MLTKLSQEHKIVVSCMCSDHPRMTTSGFVSNHTYGRGLDIASIDGEIVSPGSALAREVASELSEFDSASIRGDEIGSPFAISGPGYFTDAAHQNHIHVGFKTEISPDWEPPPGLRADAPAAAPVAAPAVAGAPVAGVAAAPGAPAAPTDPSHGSGLFEAIARPEPAKTAAAGGAGGGDSGLFSALDPKARPPAQPAQVAAAARPGARRRPGGGRGRRRGRRQRGQRRLSGRRRHQGAARRLDGQARREARPPAPAPRHGLTRRIGAQEPQLRRRRLASGSSRCG